MAQHDYNIANQSGADFRSDLNNALSAIASTNSGDTAPATTFANQLWIDTANNLLKIRNEANSAWITTGISITADNTFNIDGGTVNGITALSFSSGSSVTTILDEDNLASDSATALATQQSIKAYVDSQVGSVDTLAEILSNGNTTGGSNIFFADNDKAVFGAGLDLEIYHDGSHSYIKDNGTGNLNIIANEFAVYEGNGTDLMIGATPNGAVTLSHNAQTKLATTSTGIGVTGVITTDGLTTSADINFGDSDKAVFGTSSDLQIYHDGSNSHVRDQGTGDILISASDKLIIRDTTDGAQVAVFDTDGPVSLNYGNATKFTTTSSGIDVTGAIETDGVNSSVNIKVQREFPAIQLENTVTTGRNAYFKQNANRLDLVSQNDTTNGLITFRGYDGTTESEWARFNTSGSLLFGKTTTAISEAGVKIENDDVTITKNGTAFRLNRLTSTGAIQQFNQDGTTVGSISVTASATAYNTSSDYRLKENIEYDFTAIDRVKDLKPCRFNFIADADTTVDGFIAHEVENIVPEAISGQKDAVETYIDDEGVEQTRPSYQGIDQSKLVPLLAKAIQEQQAQIESLQAQINDLKGE